MDLPIGEDHDGRWFRDTTTKTARMNLNARVIAVNIGENTTMALRSAISAIEERERTEISNHDRETTGVIVAQRSIEECDILPPSITTTRKNKYF